MKRKFCVKPVTDKHINMPAPALSQLKESSHTCGSQFQFDDKNIVYQCSPSVHTTTKPSFGQHCALSKVKVSTESGASIPKSALVVTSSGNIYDMSSKPLKETLYGGIMRSTRLVLAPSSPSSTSATEYISDPSLGKFVVKFYTAKKLQQRRHQTFEDPMMEAAILQLLHDPSRKHMNLIDCVEYCQDDNGNLYIVMDYIDGKEVNDIITGDSDQPPQILSEKDAKKMLRQAIEGLSWLHYCGYAHCDMSLENLMYDKVNDRYIIIDYGMAYRCARHNQSSVVKGVKYQEMVKDMQPISYSQYYCWVSSYPRYCGKHFYMAPELWSQQELIHPMLLDMWALGVMLCIAVTGIPPCERAIVGDNCFKCIEADQVIDMYRHFGVTTLSPECMDLMARLLKVNPLDRPSLEEVLAHPWMSE